MKKNYLFVVFGGLLILFSIGISIFFIHTASIRNLTNLENVLFQSISLTLGIVGSVILGRESSVESAKELIKPYARSAFRRSLSLYNGLYRIATIIQEMKLEPKIRESSILSVLLDKLNVMIGDQIYTANDSLEDWRDIVPEDVAELERRLNKNSGDIK